MPPPGQVSFPKIPSGVMLENAPRGGQAKLKDHQNGDEEKKRRAGGGADESRATPKGTQAEGAGSETTGTTAKARGVMADEARHHYPSAARHGQP